MIYYCLQWHVGIDIADSYFENILFNKSIQRLWSGWSEIFEVVGSQHLEKLNTWKATMSVKFLSAILGNCDKGEKLFKIINSHINTEKNPV